MSIKNINLFLIPAALIAPISAQAIEYLSVEQSQKIIFPQANSFQNISLSFSQEEKNKIEEMSGLALDDARMETWKVLRDGTVLGYFFINEVIGKHEYITYALGLENTGKIKSLEILQYREAHGQEIIEESWRKQFCEKDLSAGLEVAKEIKNISGATLSCKHVTAGIRRLLAIYQTKLR